MPIPSIQERTERELLEMLWRDAAPFAVYIYTPWCGTCKVGEKMLSVALAIEPGAAVYKSDINYLPALTKEWRIESVPCLAFAEGKRVKEKLYRMTSADFLLAKIRERLL
ncbi:thioredoxin family protein [Paenibacillus thermotolerans]|uniref:thioredoxin family protein n=1 Tax=Paenibacillus thermotolerans TaxID=3027807 RepID=UPI002368C63F|nr:MULTISPECIES: thioredoxin family protein [unclassified Paenibacillus]